MLPLCGYHSPGLSGAGQFICDGPFSMFSGHHVLFSSSVHPLSARDAALLCLPCLRAGLLLGGRAPSSLLLVVAPSAWIFEIFSAACEVILLCAPDLGHGTKIVHCFTPSVAGITVLDTGQKVYRYPIYRIR